MIPRKDTGVVKLRLALDKSNFIREVRQTARQGGTELQKLNTIYQQQNQALRSSVVSSQQILRISKGATQQQKLKMLSDNRELQLARTKYSTAQRQLRIERTMLDHKGKSQAAQIQIRTELQRVARISQKLERQKIDLGFTNATKQIKAAHSEIRALTTGVKGLGLAAKGALIGTGAGAALASISALTAGFKATAGAPLAAIQSYRSYDQALSQLSVVAQKSREELTPLIDTIKRMGIETSKAPADVANLAVSFSRLGFSTEETAEALEGIIRLNEAGGGVLEETGASIAAIISTFGLAASDTTNIADIFVKTANNSGTSVAALGAAFDRSGQSAGAYSQSVKNTAFSLGILANNGFRDADRASTAYNQSLTQLIAKADQLKDGLGIDVFDIDTGNARQLTEIVADLSEKLTGLSDKDVSTILNDIVPDKRAQKGLLALINGLEEGNEKTEKLRQELENLDGAAKAAGAKVLDSSSGQLDLLTGKAQTFANTFAGAVDPAVKQVYNSLGNVVDELLENDSLFEGLSEEAKKLAETLDKNPAIVENISKNVTELLEGGLKLASKESEKLIKFLGDEKAVNNLVDGMQTFAEELGRAVKLMMKLAQFSAKVAATMRENNPSTFGSRMGVRVRDLITGGGGGGAAGAGALVGITGDTGRGTGPHLDVRLNRAYAQRSGRMLGGGLRGAPTDEELGRLATNGTPLNQQQMTSPAGPRNLFGNSYHEGVDYAANVGTPITSTVPIESVSKPRLDGAGGGWYTVVTFTDGVALNLLHQDPSVERAELGGGSQPSQAQTQNATGRTVSSDRARQAFDFFKGEGYSDEGAAMATGVIRQESNFDPSAVGDGGRAHGLFQWHPDRRDASFPAGDFQGQLEYATRELAGPNGAPGFNEAMRSNDVGRIEQMFDAAIRQGHTGSRYAYGRRYLNEFGGSPIGATGGADPSGGSTIVDSAEDPNMDPTVAAYLRESNDAKGEEARKEAEREAKEAHRAALEAAKQARSQAQDLRSETNRAADMARDAEIAATRSTEDIAIESARAANPSSDLVDAVASRAEEQLSAYRKISDEIEKNNRAARDLNEAIADEQSNASVEEPVNEGVIGKYKEQLEQLGKSNEMLRGQRDKELEILELKYEQITAEEKLNNERRRTGELTELTRQQASLEVQLEIETSDDPLETLELELDSALADIGNRYEDEFTSIREKLMELTNESAALTAIVELDPSAADALAQVNSELEHTTELMQQLATNRGLEESLAAVDLQKFEKERRTEFTEGLDTRAREADLDALERERGPYARRQRERELGGQDILAQSVRDMQKAQELFGASSPQFNEAVEAIKIIAEADLSDLIDQTRTLGEELGGAIGEEAQSALKGLVTGTKSWNEALADVASNLASVLFDMAMSSFGGGGGIAGVIGGLFAADGHIPGTDLQALNAFDGHIPNYAGGNAGGIIQAAIRESQAMPAGASLVMANSKETILNPAQSESVARQLSSTTVTQGDVSANVTATVNNYGEGQNDASVRAMIKDLEPMVLKIVQKHSRPGRSLYKGSR